MYYINVYSTPTVSVFTFYWCICFTFRRFSAQDFGNVAVARLRVSVYQLACSCLPWTGLVNLIRFSFVNLHF